MCHRSNKCLKFRHLVEPGGLEQKYDQINAHGYDKSLLNHKVANLIDKYEVTKSQYKRSYASEIYILKQLKYSSPLGQAKVGGISSLMISSYIDRCRQHVKPSTISKRLGLLRCYFAMRMPIRVRLRRSWRGDL